MEGNMKKSIICLIISSILLVQCFSPFEITKQKFILDDTNKPLGVTTTDEYEYIFDENTAKFEIKSDSLMLISYTKIEPISGLPYFGTDTLNMNNIKSIYVSKLDGIETLLWISGLTGLAFLLFFFTMSGGGGSLLGPGSF